MNDYHDDLAAAERLIQLGYDAEARRILIALVDAVPLNGRAWYLLSRVAENNEQRTRFLRRAQQMGYLDTLVPIDEDALSPSAQTSARPDFAIDRAALPGPPSAGAVAIKGGWRLARCYWWDSAWRARAEGLAPISAGCCLSF